MVFGNLHYLIHLEGIPPRACFSLTADLPSFLIGKNGLDALLFYFAFLFRTFILHQVLLTGSNSGFHNCAQIIVGASKTAALGRHCVNSLTWIGTPTQICTNSLPGNT